ncbi:nucleotidyltransferase family protein [Spirosoma sp. SC4-14]|uniref:nucleotidyltransferase family protein n=1 Tax=Spirosoma sp. SC4-14 TaxID=3128900 RepID=UPI0030D134ED
MADYSNHIVSKDAPVTRALEQITGLGKYLTLFVTDETEKLLGTLTDGDIRRGLLRGNVLTAPVSQFMNPNFRFLRQHEHNTEIIQQFRKQLLQLIPEIDSEGRITRIINLATTKALLPIDAVIMAGGKGERLLPLTSNTPKPLLRVGNKPIIEHNVDRLIRYGINHIHITTRYLGEQLEAYFSDGSAKGIHIDYTREVEPLGTIGAMRLTATYHHDTVLLMNSDLLTNIDFEDFYEEFRRQNADMSVATVPYQVSIPYAVLETDDGRIRSLKEKPNYTYYINAGIYLMKRSLIDMIPEGEYNATDLLEKLIAEQYTVTYFPMLNYWLDIGRPEDYQKACVDINHITL